MKIRILITLSILFCFTVRTYAGCEPIITNLLITPPSCTTVGSILVGVDPNTPTPQLTFTWYLNGVLLPGITSSSNTNASGGTYKVVCTDLSCVGGASDDTTFTVQTVGTTFTLSSTKIDTGKCFNKSDGKITLLLSGNTNNLSYQWSPNTVETDSIAENLAKGSYFVTITDLFGCASSFGPIIVPSKATDSLKIDSVKTTTPQCGIVKGSIQIYVSGESTLPIKYTFNGVDSTQLGGILYDNLTDGSYSIILDNGCRVLNKTVKLTDTTIINASIVGDTLVCIDHVSGNLKVHVSTGKIAPLAYMWSPNVQDTSATVSGLAAGNYAVIIVNGVNCRDTVDFSIGVIPQETVSIQGGKALNQGETTILTAAPQTFSKYVWSPDSLLTKLDGGTRALVFPTTTTWYHLSATYAGVCIAKDSVEITVNMSTQALDIPNIFTPNGDGINDNYYVKDINKNIDFFEIKIFDRLGNLVYTSYSVDGRWNGRDEHGSELEIGSYTYLIRYKAFGTKSTEKYLSGNIALVR